MSKTATKNKFWKFSPVNVAQNKPAELILYGDISSTTWYGDEITPQLFSDDLIGLGDVSEIVVRINSGGGDVFAAFGIFTRLKDHPAHITVKIDGWAGSAATIIASAGDKVLIPAPANYMVHPPAIGLMGYFRESDFSGFAEELRTVKNSIIEAYKMKTGKSSEELLAMVDSTTWLTGREAVEHGFADELMFSEIDTQMQNAGKVIVNSVEFDLSRFSSIPTSLLGRSGENPNGFTYIPLPENQQTIQSSKESVQTMADANPIVIKNANDLRAQYPDFSLKFPKMQLQLSASAYRILMLFQSGDSRILLMMLNSKNQFLLNLLQ